MEIRPALRALRRSPGYTAIAILMVALGIGANTAIFSIVHSVLLKPLSYHEPERLVRIQEVFQPLAHLYPELPVNARHHNEWRKKSRTLASVALEAPVARNLTGHGEPEQLQVSRVSWNYFDVLGVQPRLGRFFEAREEGQGSDQVMVLSDAFWRRRFQSDPNVLGRTVTLDGVPMTVIGVLPPDFRSPVQARRHADLFKPFDMDLGRIGWVGEFNFLSIGRMAPGVTLDQARAEVKVLQQQIASEYMKTAGLQAKITPLDDMVLGDTRRPLLVLQAAVLGVLLIVCVNLASLALVRAVAKGRDLAVRAALGASRSQLIRSLLAESVIVSVLGGVLGVVVGAWVLRLLVMAAPATIPRLDEVQLSWPVVAFAVALTVVTAILVGLLPALRLSKRNPQELLQAASAKLTESRGAARLRGALVTAEVALSVILLATTALLGLSLANVLRVDRGFETENIVAVEMSLPGRSYPKPEDRARFLDRLTESARTIPRVVSAGLTSYLPLQGETRINGIDIEGEGPRPKGQDTLVNVRLVSPGFFRALGVPLRQGRFMEEGDHGRMIAVLSESAARKIFPAKNPLDVKIREAGSPTNRPFAIVVGVVADVRTSGLEKDAAPIVYFPYWYGTEAPQYVSLLVRSPLDTQSIATTVRAAVKEIDGSLPIARVRTMQGIVDESTASRRFNMALILVFSLTALLLAALGIYGVVSYSVEQRTNEIGIRMAFGARPADLAGLVLRQGMLPVIGGLIAGLGGALASGRVIQGLLFGVQPGDWRSLSTVIAVLTIVGLMACLIPARRAARLDPMAALRHE